MKKQTTIEWLWAKLLNDEFNESPDELFEKAKEMEQERLKDASNIAERIMFVIDGFEMELYQQKQECVKAFGMDDDMTKRSVVQWVTISNLQDMIIDELQKNPQQ